jgi:DNA-binding response OmpR family regulator
MIPKPSTQAFRTILLVGDTAWVADVLDFILQARGYAVRKAFTHATALAMLEEGRPDLVLLHLETTGQVYGAGIVRALAEGADGEPPPIMALLEKTDAGAEARMKEAGASVCAPRREMTLDALLDLVDRWACRRSRERACPGRPVADAVTL